MLAERLQPHSDSNPRAEDRLHRRLLPWKGGVDGSSPTTSTTPMQTSTWCSLVGVPPAEKFRRQIEAG